MAGSQFQLRFEYAQDQLGLCTDVRPGHTCGVSLDNVVIRNVISVAPSPALLSFEQTLARDPVTNEIIATITVTNNGGTPATNVQLTSVRLGSIATTSPLPLTRDHCARWFSNRHGAVPGRRGGSGHGDRASNHGDPRRRQHGGVLPRDCSVATGR